MEIQPLTEPTRHLLEVQCTQARCSRRCWARPSFLEWKAEKSPVRLTASTPSTAHCQWQGLETPKMGEERKGPVAMVNRVLQQVHRAGARPCLAV